MRYPLLALLLLLIAACGGGDTISNPPPEPPDDNSNYSGPPPATAEPEPSALDRAFAQIDPDTLSPREALELVYTLKKLSTQQ